MRRLGVVVLDLLGGLISFLVFSWGAPIDGRGTWAMSGVTLLAWPVLWCFWLWRKAAWLVSEALGWWLLVGLALVAVVGFVAERASKRSRKAGGIRWASPCVVASPCRGRWA